MRKLKPVQDLQVHWSWLLFDLVTGAVSLIWTRSICRFYFYLLQILTGRVLVVLGPGIDQ